MTDNEKAATFIGWVPDTTDRKCTVCDAWESQCEPQYRREHDFRARLTYPAPDMSQPENVMKAFRALVLRGLFVEASYYLAVGGPWAHYKIWPKEGQVSEDAEPLVDVLNFMGGAPSVEVLTLAALYAAEHKEQS